jgi:hypothetical protein
MAPILRDLRLASDVTDKREQTDIARQIADASVSATSFPGSVAHHIPIKLLNRCDGPRCDQNPGNWHADEKTQKSEIFMRKEILFVDSNRETEKVD